MEYAIIVYEDARDLAERTSPAYLGAYTAYTEALVAAGVMRGGAALQAPATATRLRVRDDRREVHDGPFADTKEQFGGFYVIEAADLDEALRWASRCPAAARAGVEVRPLMSGSDNQS